VITLNQAIAQFGDPAISCRYYIPWLPYGLPSLWTNEVSVPFRTISFGQHQAAATTLNFPESYDAPDLTISIPENYQYTVTKGLEKWSQAIVNDDGFFGLPVDYKHDIAIILLDTAKMQVAKTVLCLNCSFQGQQAHTYGSSSDVIVAEIPLKVDRIRIL
jgi:hypothetical protein